MTSGSCRLQVHFDINNSPFQILYPILCYKVLKSSKSKPNLFNSEFWNLQFWTVPFLFKIQLPDAVSKNGLDLSKDFRDFPYSEVWTPKPHLHNFSSSEHTITVWSPHVLKFKLNPGRCLEKRPCETQTLGRVSASKDKHILIPQKHKQYTL